MVNRHPLPLINLSHKTLQYKNKNGGWYSSIRMTAKLNIWGGGMIHIAS